MCKVDETSKPCKQLAGVKGETHLPDCSVGIFFLGSCKITSFPKGSHPLAKHILSRSRRGFLRSLPYQTRELVRHGRQEVLIAGSKPFFQRCCFPVASAPPFKQMSWFWLKQDQFC